MSCANSAHLLMKLYQTSTQICHGKLVCSFFSDYTTMRQHIIKHLHKISYGSAYLGIYSTWLVILLKLLASDIILEFVKITYVMRDASPIAAAGYQKMRF